MAKLVHILLFGSLFPATVLSQCMTTGCCAGRNDDCLSPADSSVECYCDESCFNEFNDCCPDFLDICTGSGSISIFPRFGTMLGGTKISVFGRFAGATSATCQFGDSEQSEAVIDSTSVLTCVSPTVFVTGRVSVTVTVDGVEMMSNFIYLRPDQLPTDVTHVNGDQWSTGEQSPPFEISWDSNLLSSDNVDIELWMYNETEPGVPTLRRTLTIATRQPNSGGFQVDVPSIHSRPPNAIGPTMLRVVERRPRGDTRSPAFLWSDVHVPEWVFPVQNNAEVFCAPWLMEEKRRGLDFLEVLQQCPCTIREARRLRSNMFSPDPMCTQNSTNPRNCVRKPGAVHCVRAANESQAGGGIESCYGENGRLLNFKENDGGGFAQRVHHTAMVPFFSNFLADTLPWFRCCPLGSTRSCDEFQEVRISQMCTDNTIMIIITVAGVVVVVIVVVIVVVVIVAALAFMFGDPHLETLDGYQYTFNGRGEFLYTEIGNGLFVSHVREFFLCPLVSFHICTNSSLDYSMERWATEKGASATIINAIAAKHQNSDVVHLEVLPSGNVEVRILTENDTIGVNLGMNTQCMGQNVVIYQETFEGQAAIIVQFPDAISLRITEDSGMLTVSLQLPMASAENPIPTRGLLGVWNGDPNDDLMDSSGKLQNKTDEGIHKFGLSWNVSAEDALFYRPPNAEPPFFFPEFQPVFTPTNTEVSAEDLAATCNGNLQCQFDYLATGNQEIAQVTMGTVMEINKDLEEMALVEAMCPPLNNTDERRVTVSGSLVGDTATYTCLTGYTLIGSSTTTCTASNEPGGKSFWSNPPPTCSLNTVPAVKTCPDGWTYLGGDCYRIFSDDALTTKGLQQAADYYGRRQVCQCFQGTLAILEPFISNLALWNQLIPFGTGELFAIGLDDLTTEGIFRWLDGTTPTQTAWASDQPADGPNDENCVFVRSGIQLLWEDLPCDTPAQFICKRHASRDNDVCGETVPDSKPAVGYLLGRTSDSRRCVATLISSRWAVTSAPCGWANRVVFGTNTISENPPPSAQVREVIFFPDPKYDRASGSNDVALLFLDEPVTFNSFVKPMCVDTSQSSSSTCFSSSWGSFQNEIAQVLQTHDYSRTQPRDCASFIDPFAESDAGIKDCIINQDQGAFVPCEQDTGAPFHCVESGRETLVAVTAKGFCNDALFNRMEIGTKVNTNLFMAVTTESEFFDCAGNGVVLLSQLCNCVIDCPSGDDEIGCDAVTFGTEIPISSPKFGIELTNFVDRAWLFRAQSSSIHVTVTGFTLAPTNGSLMIGMGTDPTNQTRVVHTIASSGGSFMISSEYVWIAYSKRSIETKEGFQANIEIR